MWQAIKGQGHTINRIAPLNQVTLVSLFIGSYDSDIQKIDPVVSRMIINIYNFEHLMAALNYNIQYRLRVYTWAVRSCRVISQCGYILIEKFETA